MAIAKNNIINFEELLNYLLPAGVADNYINKLVDNSGKESSIWGPYWPGSSGRAHGGQLSDNWTMGTTEVGTGRTIYVRPNPNTMQVDLAALIQQYLHNNDYNPMQYRTITAADLVKIQSMIVAFIQTNVHKFQGIINPNNARAWMNHPTHTNNSVYGVRSFSTPTTYTPINTNPGTNVPTVDPNNLLDKQYKVITARDVEAVRDVIKAYLENVSTLTVQVAAYCHTNCYCHSCCCSCSCGHGKWL
jgi:hypothetical protein